LASSTPRPLCSPPLPYTTLFRSLGVLGGLAVLRSFDEAGLRPRRPIVVAAWTEEQGVRFGTDMLGSAVAAGSATSSSASGSRVRDRKSTRLNSSHVSISYAVFCL